MVCKNSRRGKSRKWLIGALTGVAVVCAATSFAFLKKTETTVFAESLSLESELKETYFLGEVIELPEGTVSFDETLYEAESMLYYPSGMIQNGQSYALSEEGTYTAVYYAMVGDKAIKADKQFEVNIGSYTVPDNSSCSWTDTLATMGEEDATAGGISVTLVSGATFTYNGIINLNDRDANTPLFSFTPYQTTRILGESGNMMAMEVKSFYVRITDAYKESNYIDIYFLERQRIYNGTNAYPNYAAAGSGQEFIGLEAGTFGSNVGTYVDVDGVTYLANPKGYGMVSKGIVPMDTGGGYSIFYDDITKCVYVGVVDANRGNGIYKNFVNDLDNENVYPNNAFQGFTTGEVHFSIWGNDYQGNTFRFELTSIDGATGDALKATRVVDDKAPTISFSNEDMPQTLYVKQGVETALPEATAYDVHLKDDVKRTVYYNYGTSNQTFIDSTNGKFVPRKTGRYTVEYFAEDTFGNTIVKTIDIVSVNEEVLSFTVEAPESVLAGGYAVLPVPEISALNDGLYCDAAVYFGTERVALDDGTMRFFVEHVGEYTFEYTYGDFLHKKSYSLTITALGSNTVTFSQAVLPEYFIKNATYTLDAVEAYTYRSENRVGHETKAYVSEDDGAWTEINVTEYTTTASETVKFKFEYEGEALIGEEIGVVDVGFGSALDMGKYFVGDVTSERTRNHVRLITASGKTGEIKFDFVNTIAFSTFAFAFNVPDTAAYDGVELILTDYYDPKNSVSVYVEKRTDGMAVLKCGLGSVALDKQFVGGEFYLIYDSKNGKLTDDYGKGVSLLNPFASDKLLLGILLKNVEKSTFIDVEKVGNQTMNDKSADLVEGTLKYLNTDGGVQQLGKVVTIYGATATDVLSPFNAQKLYVSVMTEDGRFVQSTDGVRMERCLALRDYGVKLEEYGTYIVTYSYFDANRNETTSMYYISVSDTENPTLTLSDGYGRYTVVTGKLGDTITVASYEAKDSVSAADALTTVIFVQKPNGVMERVQDGTFTAETAGDYIVMYYCSDEFGNYATAQYIVRVS